MREGEGAVNKAALEAAPPSSSLVPRGVLHAAVRQRAVGVGRWVYMGGRRRRNSHPYTKICFVQESTCDLLVAKCAHDSEIYVHY